jgi:hypothetical protein
MPKGTQPRGGATTDVTDVQRELIVPMIPDGR